MNQTAILSTAIVAPLALSMFFTRAALIEKQQSIDFLHARTTAQTQAILSLSDTLLEQHKQLDALSRTIAELQAQVEEAAYPLLDIPLSPALQEHTYREAERMRIDPDILFALMERESSFRVDAWCIDSNGYESVGLCQINQAVHPFLRSRGIDWTSPEGNITAACELISYYRDERGYTLPQSLAAYQAGETGMLRGEGQQYAEGLLEEGRAACS